MRFGKYLCLAMLLGMAACGPATEKGQVGAPDTSIRSTDFAILACSDQQLRSPCAVIMAGGKRVIIGAPAGVTALQTDDDLRNTDAVLLMSLRGEGVEGLDELRNRGWQAGREGPLPVGGPTGTGDFIGALNRAYEVSDALIFVEDSPEGGFDAALLALLPGEGATKAVVFDTGDLQITKIETATSRAGYWVDYAGHRAVFEPCGMTQAVKFADQADYLLTCESGWKIDAPIYVYRDTDS